MKKEEFINKLRKKISILEKSEIDDIVEEYEGYIDEKKNAGMSEEEAVKALGDVNEIAKDLLSAYKIKDDYSKNEAPDFIQKIVDYIMNIVDYIIAIFNNKSPKDVMRIIVEIILLVIFISVLKIPFYIVNHTVQDLFSNFGPTVSNIFYSTWLFITEIIYVVLALILFFKLLKEKILDPNVDEKIINASNKSTAKIIKESDNEKESKTVEKDFSKNREKTGIIDMLSTMLLYFVKFIALIFTFINGMAIFSVACLIAVAFYLIINGVTYYGALMIVIAGIMFLGTTFEILINFIFDKKNCVTRIVVTTILSFILAGVGTGVFATEIASSSYIKDFNGEKMEQYVEEIEMKDNLVLDYYHSGYKVVIDEELTNIKLVRNYYSQYFDFEFNSANYNEDNYLIIENYYDITWNNNTFKKLMNDAKDKKFHDFSNIIKTEVHISTENYNKLKENYEKYQNEKRQFYDEIDDCDGFDCE